MSLCLFLVRGRRSAGPSVSAFSLARPSGFPDASVFCSPLAGVAFCTSPPFRGLRPSSGASFPVVFPPGADGRRRRREGTLWPLPLREKPVVCAGLLPARSERFRALGKSHESLPPAASALLFPLLPLSVPFAVRFGRANSGRTFRVPTPLKRRLLFLACCRAEDRTSAKAGSGRAFRVPTAPLNKRLFCLCPLQGRRSDICKSREWAYFPGADGTSEKVYLCRSKKIT